MPHYRALWLIKSANVVDTCPQRVYYVNFTVVDFFGESLRLGLVLRPGLISLYHYYVYWIYKLARCPSKPDADPKKLPRARQLSMLRAHQSGEEVG